MSAAKLHKGYCSGCPFNYGDPATETAWNLGCLPGSHEVLADCKAEGQALSDLVSAPGAGLGAAAWMHPAKAPDFAVMRVAAR